MTRERVRGLADAFAMFEEIPRQADQELVVELAVIGRDVLAIQRQRVPVRTGRLDGALSLAVLVDGLRLRIGLLNQKTAPFYGRIVEFGRRAQTVLVQRRRRVDGRLRVLHRRKRAEDIAASYKLHVSARAPRPFVDPPDLDLVAVATERLANFWSNVLSRSGASR